MIMGKKFNEKAKLVDRTKSYSLSEAVDTVLKTVYTKFDEAVDLAMNLGIDPKKSDQQVRGTVLLPAGAPKSVKLAVIVKGDKVSEAQAAGADIVGSDDLVKKIQDGFLDFDVLIAAPDMMAQVGRLGKILGPKGLMPSPKSGTVTVEIEKCVKEFKSGKLEFKADKLGGIHLAVGRISFGKDKLLQNLKAVIGAVLHAKPHSVKVNYLRGISISSSMGPGIKLNPSKIGGEI